ncbi:MAG: ABC transporter ATP-binding protein [Actinobacteria bacterium]|nr:ABC transporter ATP-binding protein [Actinomycetota bacterium]
MSAAAPATSGTGSRLQDPTTASSHRRVIVCSVETTDSAVDVRDLRVVRGRAVVLERLSLTVARGVVTGLLGPSGSGKSTLMRSIVGVQRVAGGTVDVLGEPAGAPSLRRRIGYVTQAPSIYADLTVRENLRYFARLLNASLEQVDEAIETVGLGRHAGHVVGRLSGGEQARASLATALLGSPELLVLDEPTVGLDPLLRRDLWDTFQRLAAAGKSLLVSSHVMDEAERCDRLLLLRGGRLLAWGTPAELRERTHAQALDDVFLRLIEAQ